MNYKNRFFTEDEIISATEEVCVAIEEHGWKCADGHWLTAEELQTWTDEMFMEAFERIYGFAS